MTTDASVWDKRFRLVASLEAASFVLLLFVAMPLKYFAGLPLAVRIVGMAHGLLFIAYTAMIFDALSNRDWSRGRAAVAFVAGLLPFGAFVFESRLRHGKA